MKQYEEVLKELKNPATQSVKIKSKDLVPFIRFLNQKKYYDKLYISTFSKEYTELKK